jgi:hypothetical protein
MHLNLFDRLIASISPAWGLKRLEARRAIERAEASGKRRRRHRGGMARFRGARAMRAGDRSLATMSGAIGSGGDDSDAEGRGEETASECAAGH